jgi:uncharacterized protein YbbC (DUF1343 family)
MPRVLTGLDILAADDFAPLRGGRVGLITNHTAIDARRRHILDLMLAGGVDVAALFSPEHGFAGQVDERVGSSLHAPTGLPIHSLYGDTEAPTPQMLEGLGILVFDIADIGVRFYTYTTTMALCLRAAAEAGLRFVVLDRPDPITGNMVEGPVLDEPFKLLSAWHPVALRHGMTVGELALWSNTEYCIRGDLDVLGCHGWDRGMWFDETGLPWVNPSPNMRNLREAILYPAICPLEACSISVGRGTDTPFELFGAPWIDDMALAEALNAADMPALSFVPIRFTPTSSKFVGEECGGCYVMLESCTAMRPVEAAVKIALELKRLFGDAFDHQKMAHLLGSKRAVEAIGALTPADNIICAWQAEKDEFAERRKAYLLY